MINRNLLRMKVVQVLYSYYKNQKETNDFAAAQEELMFSIDKTYELYHYFFQLIINITSCADKKLERKQINQEEFDLNNKLSTNRFVAQLKQNKQLKSYLEEHEVEWLDNDSNATREIHKQIIESDLMKEYAAIANPTYEDDKELWKNIFKRIIPDSELLGKELEDLSIYWNDDAEIVVSFVVKTIKQFDEAQGPDQPLLPKFKDAEDEAFAITLFKKSIYDANDYKELISKHTKNWDADRIAFLDTIIMQTALAEICNFPSIPVNVSMNEYLEIAKAYSTSKSSNFINGVLDAIVKELTNEKKITKVAYINNYKK
ncbi:MAG: transcription antitermination factor NusB [Paludibacteraceae bacterium]|nr:transcription antitermination factor NusB [Paludibacteraceae bacterium]